MAELDFESFINEKQPKDLSEQQGLASQQALDPAQAQPTSHFDQFMEAKPQPVEHSLFDETIGAAEYGLADVGEQVTKNIGETFGSSTFTDWAGELESFKREHPQYGPEEVQNAWGYLTNPGALLSRVSGAAPYVLFTAGTSLIPYVGPYLAGGLVYSIESERAYHGALDSGATESEARRAGVISGVINGGLQLMFARGLFKFGEGGEQSLVAAATRYALGQSEALGAVGSGISYLAKQGLIMAAQGGVNELVPLGVYGKPLEPGFIDRRLQDALVGAASTEVFGPLISRLPGAKSAIGSDGEVKEDVPLGEQVDVNTTSHQQSVKKLLGLGYTSEDADALSAIYHQRAVNWSQAGGGKVEEFYARNPIEKLGGPVEQVPGGDGKVEGGSKKQATEGPGVGVGQEARVPPPSTSEMIVSDGEAILSALKAMQSDKLDMLPGQSLEGVGTGKAINLGDLNDPGYMAKLKATVEEQKAQTTKGEGSDGPADGFVRMYHGGRPYGKDGGTRWLTPSIEQAQGYVDKNPSSSVLQYVDVPEDHPLITKAYDDTGTSNKAPPNSFDAPEELAKRLKPVVDEPTNELAGYSVGWRDGKSEIQFDGEPVKPSLPDVRSTIKGLWELMKGDLLPEEQAALAEQFPESKRGRSQSDKVVDALMRYTWDKSGVDPSIAPAFERLNNWVKQQWGTLRDAGIRTKLSPGQKAFLDNLLYKDSPLISQKRAAVMQADADIEGVAKAISKSEGDPAQTLQQRIDLKNATDMRDQLQGELEQAQEGRFIPDAKPEGEGQEILEYPQKLGRETLGSAQKRSALTRATNEFMRYMVSAKNPLNGFESGRKFTNWVADAATGVSRQIGRWEVGEGKYSRRELNVALADYNTRSWMMDHDENMQANITKLVDATAQAPLSPDDIPETFNGKPINKQAVLDYVQGINLRNRDYIQQAKDLGFTYRDRQGRDVPIDNVEGQRHPRMMRAEWRQAMITRTGAKWDAMVDYVLKHNPSITSLDEAGKALDRDYGQASIKNSSSLGFQRKIVNMPDVLEVNDKVDAVMHLEPNEVLANMVKTQAQMVEYKRIFGQGTVDTVSDKSIQRLAKIVGVDSGIGEDAYDKQLEKAGVGPDELAQMGYDEKKQRMTDLDLPLGKTVPQLVDEILSTSPNALSKSTIRELASFADELGGIKSEVGYKAKTLGVSDEGEVVRGKSSPVYDAKDLLQKIKTRLTTKVNNNLDVLMEKLKLEGGDAKHAQDMLAVAQGLPYHWMPDNTVTRVAKFTGDMIGIIQTPFAFIPHIWSNLVQLPGVAGPVNTLSAMAKVYMGDGSTIHDAMLLNTGFARAELVRQAEPSYSLTRMGKLARTAAGRLTGLDYVNETQKTVAYEAMRAQAQDWRENGIPRGKEGVARSLNLSNEEIAQSRTGKMTDRTFAKIIQEGMGVAQAGLAKPYNKALVESWPLLKGLFAYNTYVFGNTRTNLGIVNDLKDSVKQGDMAGIWGGTQRLVSTLAGSLGAGVAIGMMREAIKGTTPQHVDDDWWDTVTGALNETAGLGMLHRFNDAFKYDGGSLEKTAYGLMPQVSFLTHVLGTLVGYGRYGELPLGERATQAITQQSPLLRAFNQWSDNVAHPDLVTYQEARAALGKWKRVNEPVTPGNEDSPINPDYLHVFNAVQRGDLEGAQDEMMGLFQKGVEKGIDPRKVVDEVRTSLINRAPVDVGSKKVGLYIGSLSSERAGKYLQAQGQYMAVVNSVAPSLSH